LHGELRDSLQGLSPQRGGIARDQRFIRPIETGNAAIQGRNELVEFANHPTSFNGHPWPPFRCRRASFQTSPHFVQRQYVLESGFFAVVTIAGDLHVGHDPGPVMSGLKGADRPVNLSWKSK
jgi:hypothetical protein